MHYRSHHLTVIALASVLALAPAVTALAQPSGKSDQKLTLYPGGSQPSQKGPPEWFTGAVRIDPLNTAPAPARHGAVSVTFEPGARTAWHVHPLGQTLVITSGAGWTQIDGGDILAIRAGDVIWCPPGWRHWHGATPTTAMSHIAIQETQDGKMVEWMEQVTEAQYRAGPVAAR